MLFASPVRKVTRTAFSSALLAIRRGHVSKSILSQQQFLRRNLQSEARSLGLGVMATRSADGDVVEKIGKNLVQSVRTKEVGNKTVDMTV